MLLVFKTPIHPLVGNLDPTTTSDKSTMKVVEIVFLCVFMVV
jgi:hypothetical protein